MDEERYHALCHSCDEILLEDPGNPSRLAVAWLHVIREHPVFLQRYQGLFTLPSIPWRLSWLGLRRGLAEILRTLRQLFRACGSDLFGVCGWQKQLDQADVVFVSHLANPSQREAETDFYFGELPALLAKRGQRVAVLLIDHTSASSTRVSWDVSERGVIRLVLPNTLGLHAEIGLLMRLWRQSGQLARQAIGVDIRAKVRMAAAAEALSSTSSQALRIAIQVGELLREMHARVLITTYEGHAWERTTYLEARRQVPGIRCGGYQHAALFRFQHGLRRHLGAGCDPDVVFISGNAALSEFALNGETVAYPILVLGSNRAGSLARLPNSEARRRRRQVPVCLVIPEGLVEESIILFRYALSCASQLQDVTFIWRLHPIISFETLVKYDPTLRNLPQNVRLSDVSLEADAERASWALYRGSTAIVSAVLAGAAPVYVCHEGEMTIDPLYALDTERAVVSSVDEFVAMVNSEQYPTVDQMDTVVRHCLEIFSPMSPAVLFDYLNDVENEHTADAKGS